MRSWLLAIAITRVAWGQTLLDRPPAAEYALAPAVLSFAGRLSERASLFVTGFIAEPFPTGDVRASAWAVGARLYALRTSALWLSIDAGTLRELGGDWGGFVQATGTWERGALRMTATLHAEKLFAAGRDPIDLFAVIDASVRLGRALRVGVEYVAQDLEEAFDPGDEGGAHQYAGPDLALAIDRRFSLTASALFELGRPGTYGRAGVSYFY